MREARQGVHLVHELRELGGPEELLDRSDDGPDVDERLGRDGLDVLGGHALADDALHARQTDADLVLDELAHRTDAPVGEVVLVIEAVTRLGGHEMQQVGAGGEHLGPREDRLTLGGLVDEGLAIGVEAVEHREELDESVELVTQLLVELVAADAGQVVATVLEEGGAEVVAGRLDRRWLTRACPLVDLHQRVVLGGRQVAVLLPLALEEVEVAHERLEEAGAAVLAVAQSSEQHEQRQAALAGDTRAGGDVLARLLLDVELDPLAAVGVDGALHELVLLKVSEAVALAGLEDHAGRPHQLGDDDPLGAVDHERALVGHHREVPHEDRLLLDLTGLGVDEPRAHEDRRGVGHVLLLALLHRELRQRAQVLVVRIELELQLEGLGEVLDRRDVAEGLLQAGVKEPVEGLTLDGDEVREGQGFVDVRERIAVAGVRASGQESSSTGGGHQGVRERA